MVLCAQERGEDVALRYSTPAGVQTIPSATARSQRIGTTLNRGAHFYVGKLGRATLLL